MNKEQRKDILWEKMCKIKIWICENIYTPNEIYFLCEKVSKGGS